MTQEKKEVKKPLTLEDKIENLKAQQEQHKEMFLKCAGAIEILQEQLNEQNGNT